MTKKWAILYIPNGTYIMKHGNSFFLSMSHMNTFYESCSGYYNPSKAEIATVECHGKPCLSFFSEEDTVSRGNVVMSNLRMDYDELLEAELEVVEYLYD